ncbi:glutamate--tRNA ligase [Cohaesibacter celericrescens]|uniref:Glutamate--tRNA ligase n=1 Tax=Cohaesibacter celericrescens TaxID=2067669 RepID=A0A2N5XSS7_9HYPH|nr:glutamate--tRNA ligase [Cohaesibacter celericrescens]PLW77505.1 glutamate--tRNA ligase [Cohaesibacter celericrescens]
MCSQVVTRFAPSPTGYLHIGGARTALFNWLYAKANGGKMLLRIEDTDRERSTDAAIDAIVAGLDWMGLSYDGDPISQHSRVERHRQVVDQLLADGNAYRCYCTPDELTEMREKARAEKRAPRYDGTWRDRDPSEAPAGVKPAIRLKAPQQGETILEDQVQGTVRFPNKDLDDMIIMRSDGNPTYNLAVVVDDHDMGVTVIMRGDDHLTNAARQSLVYKAMGWDIPTMAHIPLIHGPDGAKLSKRHGALGVEAYRDMGYLPEAMRNYLVRLGWAHGDDEVFSTEQMIEWFGFDGMNKAAARFDFKKLENINGIHMRNADDNALYEQFIALLPFVEDGQSMLDLIDDAKKKQIMMAMPSVKERAKTLLDLKAGLAFLFDTRPLALEEKAAKLLSDDARAMLGDLIPRFEQLTDWTIDSTDALVRTFAEEKELKLGKVAQPLRAALTGRSTSPGIFDVLLVLGKDESIARLKDQIS